MADVRVKVNPTNLTNVRVGQENAIKVVSSLSGGGTSADETSTNVVGGIADVTELSVSGISSLNNLEVSGISTLGTLQISSGIVTATSGIITYYGDGSNLTNTGAALSVPSTGSRRLVLTDLESGTMVSAATTSDIEYDFENKIFTVGGTINATTFDGNLTGNVTGSADSLTTSRNFSISGDVVTQTLSFDGTDNVGFAVTLKTVNSNTGSFGSQTQIPVVTVNEKGLITAVSTENVGTAMTVAGDSGSEEINLLTETLTISGGTNVTTNAASNGVEIALDDNISLGIVTANTFSTGAVGSGINVGTSSITGPSDLIIDPSAIGDDTGRVTIKGDLFVLGTETKISSQTIELADHRVGIATTVGTNLLLNGGGIGIGSTNILKTFTYHNDTNTLRSSVGLGVTSGQFFKIGSDTVLNSTTLGSGITNSSLTSVGTLINLNVGGTTTFTGISTFSSNVNIAGTLTAGEIDGGIY